MTKKESLKHFKENILPEIINQYGKDDKVAICEGWNNYTDALCKAGKITSKQYHNWTNPF